MWTYAFWTVASLIGAAWCALVLLSGVSIVVSLLGG